VVAQRLERWVRSVALTTFPSLDAVFACMAKLGAVRMAAKPLSENDNAKQQIYLGGNFESLQLIPYGTVVEDTKPETPNLKAAVKLNWISESGAAVPAPHSKLILYPQYPEIRLSGFLRGCSAAPATLLRPIPRLDRKFDNQPDGRVLLLGISSDGSIYAYLAPAGSAVARDFVARQERGEFSHTGVFYHRRLDDQSRADAKVDLLARLTVIRKQRWHWSRRMKGGMPISYSAPNGGGYTLEALFEISPNGDAGPDFRGWEIKACGSDRVTLMTPEPTGGYYGTHGAEAFLRRYGRKVENDAIYFTGVHKVGDICAASGQTLALTGFTAGGTKFDPVGRVDLVDSAERISASWSFAKLLQHWSHKHAQAAYVPCDSRPGPPREYEYGSPVLLGEETSFLRFLTALGGKSVYYDPAPKLERASTPQKKVHARSQFRIRVSHLDRLYAQLSRVEI